MKLELERYVPGLVLWLSNKLASSASSLYRERFELGVTEWRVLAYFNVYPLSTATQACELMGIDKAAASRAIATLRDGGWLRARPDGLRRVNYALTPAGKRLHDRMVVLAMAREEALLDGFSRQERETLIRSLQRMLDNLEAVRQVGHAEPERRKPRGGPG